MKTENCPACLYPLSNPESDYRSAPFIQIEEKQKIIKEPLLPKIKNYIKSNSISPYVFGILGVIVIALMISFAIIFFSLIGHLECIILKKYLQFEPKVINNLDYFSIGIVSACGLISCYFAILLIKPIIKSLGNYILTKLHLK